MLLQAPHRNSKVNLMAWKLAIMANISLLALVSGVAQAQVSAAPADGLVPEIIVTAQKREENVSTVPMSVTAVTGEQLKRSGVNEVRDLVKVSPGFSYADSYVGSPIYTLRGIGFSDISLGGRSTVSLYIDQAPIPFAIESRGVNLDVERVEILKGPQGTLFGQNATGGAINFIAAKPTKSFAAGIDASYGTFNASDLTGFISGPLSETLGARLAVQTIRSDPWQRSYTKAAENGADNVQNARLTLAWDPSVRLKVQVNVNGSNDQSDVQAGQLIGIDPQIAPIAPFVPGLLTYKLAPANARAADFNPADDYSKNNRFLQATTKIDYQISDRMILTSLTSVSQFKQDQLQDIDGTTLSNLSRHTTGKIESLSQELRITGDLDRKTRYTLGLSYADDDVRESSFNVLVQSTQALVFTGLGLPVFADFVDTNHQKSKTSAVFAGLDYQLSDELNLYGGVRYTRSDNRFSGCTADSGDGNTALVLGSLWNSIRPALGLPFNPPIPKGGCTTVNAAYAPGLVVDSLNETNVAWRVGTKWTPRERTLLYANISKGYKAGGFPSLGASTATQYLPATQESVLAYEAGFKTTSSDRKLQLNGALFYYDYQDKQILGRVLDPVFNSLLQMINVPKSKVVGAELQATWVPIEGLNLTAGGSYVESEILDGFVNFDPNARLTNFGGQGFPNTPRLQFVADINYRWPINQTLSGFVGGGVNHQDKTNSQLGELPSLNVKAYSLVDLRAGVESQSGAWRLAAWGRNVGDAYYWTAANRNLDTTVRFTGRPRTYGLSLSYRFQ